MIDPTQRRALTLICGRSGSGKTEFALRYLVNSAAVVRFVFDPDGQMSARLNLDAASTPEELEEDLASGWVVFDPTAMFTGRRADALRFFSRWAWTASERGPGRKILLVDEVWKYCNPQGIPQELAECVQDGRVRGLEMVVATQTPNRLHASIANEVTELVSFRLGADSVADAIRQYGADPARVMRLAPGQFVAWNIEEGGAELAGRVF